MHSLYTGSQAPGPRRRPRQESDNYSLGNLLTTANTSF